MTLTLTDEQKSFVETIRDFAQRECGTREQRDALTDHGKEVFNRELYGKVAELGREAPNHPDVDHPRDGRLVRPHDDDVARVRIGVEEAVLEDHLHDDPRRQLGGSRRS